MIMRVLTATWRILTLTCDESARLMSAALDERLPWGDRIAARLHIAICRGCHRFQRQLRFLSEAVRRYGDRNPQALGDADSAPSARLASRARQRLEEAIRRELDKDA